MIELRTDQDKAIKALVAHFESHNGNPLIVAPTGSGKSVIIAGFVQFVLSRWPGQRILILAHVKELISQNYIQLKRIWPEAPAGIYSAGLNRRDYRQPITFASIQSIIKILDRMDPVDLILVDEAHLIPPAGDGLYQRLIKEMKSKDPHVKIIGLTATPYRMTSGTLVGKDSLFNRIAYEIKIRDLISAGYLCPVIPKRTIPALDASAVPVSKGDYVASALQTAVDTPDQVRDAIAEILTEGHERDAWLIFCAGVQHAHHVTAELSRNGITCAAVTGELDRKTRDNYLDRFRAGTLRAVACCDILTTGFDAPRIDLIACLRPTKSPGLWVQMVGRGMRIHPGKENCLVLDFARNTEEHGPIDRIEPRKKKKKQNADPPVKCCPECRTYLAPGTLICPECGYAFPARQFASHDTKASNRALLSEKPGLHIYTCSHLMAARHKKKGKPDSLRIDYIDAKAKLIRATEYICLEHEGYAGKRARQWWAMMFTTFPPLTVDEALDRMPKLRALERPLYVTIETGHKYPIVRSLTYDRPNTFTDTRSGIRDLTAAG